MERPFAPLLHSRSTARVEGECRVAMRDGCSAGNRAIVAHQPRHHEGRVAARQVVAGDGANFGHAKKLSYLMEVAKPSASLGVRHSFRENGPLPACSTSSCVSMKGYLHRRSSYHPHVPHLPAVLEPPATLRELQRDNSCRPDVDRKCSDHRRRLLLPYPTPQRSMSQLLGQTLSPPCPRLFRPSSACHLSVAGCPNGRVPTFNATRSISSEYVSPASRAHSGSLGDTLMSQGTKAQKR